MGVKRLQLDQSDLLDFAESLLFAELLLHLLHMLTAGGSWHWPLLANWHILVRCCF